MFSTYCTLCQCVLHCKYRTINVNVTSGSKVLSSRCYVRFMDVMLITFAINDVISIVLVSTYFMHSKAVIFEIGTY